MSASAARSERWTLETIETRSILGSSRQVRAGFFEEDPTAPFNGNVLYLEGFADSMLNHGPLFAAIADAGWRVVAFDYPGQGGSNGSMNETSIAQILDLGDVVYQKLARSPDTAKRVILGWSTGGLAAYCAAAQRRTSAVILLAPGVHVQLIVGRNGKVTLDTLTSRTFPVGEDPHLDGIRPGSPGEAPAFAADLLKSSVASQRLAIHGGVAGLAILTGPKDCYVQAAETRATLRQNAPHFTIVEVPDAFHEVDNEVDSIRQKVFKAVLEFLNSPEVSMSDPSPNALLGQLVGQVEGGGGELEELFPLLRGLYALSRGESSDDPDGEAFLDLLSAQASARSGVDAGELRKALEAAVRNGQPQDLLADDNVRAALVFGARRALEANGIAASEDEVRDAVGLLLSGQAMADVASVSTVILGAHQRWPGAVVNDLLKLPSTIRTLVSGALVSDVLADLRTTIGTARRLEDITRGDFQDPVRSRTLNRFYGESTTVRSVVGTANELLHNETVVLALVIYANMHGARINREIVEVVRDSVLAADERTLAEGGPNLGPLLVAGAEYARERYGARAPEMLRGLIA